MNTNDDDDDDDDDGGMIEGRFTIVLLTLYVFWVMAQNGDKSIRQCQSGCSIINGFNEIFKMLE